MKIVDICEVVRGSSPRPKGDSRFYGGSVPRLMVADVTRDGMYVSPCIDSLTEEGAARSRPMMAGDLVIAVSGAPGLPTILKTDACIHDGFVGLRNLDQTRVHTEYLYRYLYYSKTLSSDGAVGAIFKNLTTHQIRDLEVPLPPLSEQKRIADILDKADTIHRKRLEVTDVFGTLEASVFLAFFGDPITNPYGWKMETLETVVNRDGRGLKRGPFGGSLKKEIFVKKGYKVYEQKHAIADDFTLGGYFVDEEKFQEMEAFAVRPGDLIVSCSGTMGRIAIVPESAQPGIINQALLRITPDKTKISALYLKMLLETIPVQRHFYGFSRGSGLKNFPPMKEVRALPVPVPSRKRLDEFHRYLERSHDAGENVRLLSDEANNLFNSLVQRAFRGEF